MRKLVAIFVASCLGACATVTTSSAGKGATESFARRERNYELNVQRTAVVGDAIVRVRDYEEDVTRSQTMQANESFVLNGGLVSIPFSSGERLPIYGERVNDGVTYTVLQKDWYRIQIAPDGSVAPGVINSLGTPAQVVMAYRFTPSSPTARFTQVTDTQVRRRATGQNFEIVFNGIDGQAMRFQYREYTVDDMARPAFFQDLSYPIGTSPIRFRTMVINVARVTAQDITYTVIAE